MSDELSTYELEKKKIIVIIAVIMVIYLTNVKTNNKYWYYLYKKNVKTLKYEFLCVQRKDSMGYVDLLRGKYNLNNSFQLKNILAELTRDEYDRIKNII